jgi:hypothetical protein
MRNFQIRIDQGDFRKTNVFVILWIKFPQLSKCNRQFSSTESVAHSPASGVFM